MVIVTKNAVMTQLILSAPPSSPTSVGSAVAKIICPSEDMSMPIISEAKTSGTLFCLR